MTLRKRLSRTNTRILLFSLLAFLIIGGLAIGILAVFVIVEISRYFRIKSEDQIMEPIDKLIDAANRVEAYDRARTEMIAGMSHDLKTPLTSIKGYIKGL